MPGLENGQLEEGATSSDATIAELKPGVNTVFLESETVINLAMHLILRLLVSSSKFRLDKFCWLEST